MTHFSTHILNWIHGPKYVSLIIWLFKIVHSFDSERQHSLRRALRRGLLGTVHFGIGRFERSHNSVIGQIREAPMIANILDVFVELQIVFVKDRVGLAVELHRSDPMTRHYSRSPLVTRGARCVTVP